jgi:branched-subunit amino acid transport protein
MNATLWFVFIILGILTFLTRLSFISLLDKWQAPPLFQRAMRFVPVAVLTAIILPELVINNGALIPSPLNARLIAGGIAIFVAWNTKNTVLTILIGMLAFWLLQYLLLS